MATVDVIVAAYLVGIIVVLCIGSIYAYKMQVQRGEIIEESKKQ